MHRALLTERQPAMVLRISKVAGALFTEWLVMVLSISNVLVAITGSLYICATNRRCHPFSGGFSLKYPHKPIQRQQPRQTISKYSLIVFPSGSCLSFIPLNFSPTELYCHSFIELGTFCWVLGIRLSSSVNY